MSIDSTGRKAVGETSSCQYVTGMEYLGLQHVDIHTIVQISRIDEQKINIALLNNDFEANSQGRREKHVQ